VVVKASQAGNFSIENLPAGTYGIKYTTGDGRNQPIEYDINLPDQTISAGGLVTTKIPAQGVITIYAKPLPARRF